MRFDPKEAAIWTAVWVMLALAFAGWIVRVYGRRISLTFLTGYVIEESLSIDNIFVIVLIFEYFAVPKICQHRVLFYGILGALVMRGLFIGLGAVLIARFHWILFLFGAMLVVTGVRMAFKHDDAFDGDGKPVVRFVRRVMPMSKDFHGKHFFIIEAGRRLATPLLLVLILVEFTDLIFAIDSIPATFGVTTDPFLVFTSNIFADARASLALLPARRGRRPVLPAEVRACRDPDVRRREDARRAILRDRHHAVARDHTWGSGAGDRRRHCCGPGNVGTPSARSIVARRAGRARASAAPLDRVPHVEQDLEVQLLAAIGEVERRLLRRVAGFLGALERLAVHLVQVAQNAFAGA